MNKLSRNGLWMTTLLCGLAIVCLPTLAIAKEEFSALKAREVKLRATYRKQLDVQITRERTMRMQYLSKVASQLHQVADLSDDQAAQFDSAVKEAVEHSLLALRKQLGQHYDSMVATRLGKGRTRVTISAPRGATVAENDEVWVKAMKDLLNDQQRADYASAVAGRNAFQRKTLIRRIIAEIDARVLLTQQQREQLVGVVDATLGTKKVQNVKKNLVTVIHMQSIQLLRAIDDKQLEGLLSESQKDLWQTTVRGNSK